ncbi:MAG: hypothetical protein IOD15_15365, partial [Phycisphaerales bacterium]|nr:hypothetical protein [Phycisphaerales bacterium]
MMFDDLVGVPYEQADCYELVRLGLGRLGWQVPADRAEAVRAQRWMGWKLNIGEDADVGDVVVMDGVGEGHGGGLHVGLVVERTRQLVLHAMGRGLSSVVVPLSVLQRSGAVRYVLRLRTQTQAGPPIDHREVVEAGDPLTIVLAVVGVAAAAASSLVAASRRSPEPGAPESPNRRYAFNRLASEAVAGDPIPVVFGRHVRLGGKVVAVLPGEGPNGDTILRMLICYGHGEIESIGGLRETAWTAAADVPALAAGGIYVADQPIGGLVGARVAVRVGTANQPVIPGFADAEVLRTVGSDGSLLANTSGAERTGASPSAEAVTFSTADAVNAVVLRVAFRRGLYSLGAQGGTEARTARWRWRWRTSDVGAGAGAWSAWTVQSVTRAEQAGFTTSVRLDRPGVAAARLDVQAERVSVTPATVDRVDEMTFDSVVEVRYGELTYPGMALLALEIRASEQVNSVPEVAATVLGLRVRVWDGTGSASDPVLVRQYSANPAYAALEL